MAYDSHAGQDGQGGDPSGYMDISGGGFISPVIYDDEREAQQMPQGAAASSNAGGQQEDSVPDFSMVSSSLLGGADLAITAGQRQAYIDGITAHAKYVGTIDVPRPNGDTMIYSAVTRVRSQHKSSREAKQKVRFQMSTEFVKIFFDDAAGMLKDSYPLDTISYVGHFKENKKVFCFISGTRTADALHHRCHVFKSKKKNSTMQITHTIGICFTLATELERVELHRRQTRAADAVDRRASLWAPNREGSANGTAPASGAANTPVPSSLPDSFEAAVAAIRGRTRHLGAPPDEAVFLSNALDHLENLYAQETRRSEVVVRDLEGKLRRSMNAGASLKLRLDRGAAPGTTADLQPPPPQNLPSAVNTGKPVVELYD